MRLPPKWLRRILLAPIALVTSLAAVVALPFALIAALIAGRFVPGRHRPVRVLAFALVWLALEVAVLVAAFALWIASGFGLKLRSERFVAIHYRLIGWYLRHLIATAQRVFKVRLDVVETGKRSEHAPRIVLSRHAGPGDSFLLVHNVTSRGRRPRIVLKDTFQWEPMFDTLLGRLPCMFVSPNPGAAAGDELIAGISALAETMDELDSLVIFPEGGNITESRRLRSIAKLEERGHHEQAARARAMRNVMAPRPGGVLAALDACPQAEVVLVAHTGLEELSHPVDLWRGLPMDAAVRVRSWHIPREEVPAEREARIAWLYESWAKIDAWIAGTRTEDLEF